MEWFPVTELTRDEAGHTSVMDVLASSRPDILKAWLAQDLRGAPPGVQGEWIEMGLQYLSLRDPLEPPRSRRSL